MSSETPRAGLALSPADYPWCSAAAHLSGTDATGILDMSWWRSEAQWVNWAEVLGQDDPEQAAKLRRCTYAGRPFGSDNFVSEMSRRFGRYWAPGRPKSRSHRIE
jgi:putative transposase